MVLKGLGGKWCGWCFLERIWVVVWRYWVLGGFRYFVCFGFVFTFF